MIVCGLVSTTAALVLYGWRSALGLACGCAVAYLNFHWLKRGVSGLADRLTQPATDASSAHPGEQMHPAWPASTSRKSVVAKFLLRYVLMGLAAYGILTVSPASLYGLLAGL